MTRGFIVLLINNKLYKVVESYSDSYLSNLGLQVLSLLEKNKLVESLENVQPIGSELPDLSTDNAISLIFGENKCQLFNSVAATSLDWFIKNKENEGDYFYDYSYLYDIKKAILKVYYYGKKIFTIKKEDIPFYKYIFENENKIDNVILYNEKTCKLDKDWSKEIKKLIPNEYSIEDIQNLSTDFKSKIAIDNYKTSDFFGYKRNIYRIEDNKKIATFIFSQDYMGYELLIQLPYCRQRIAEYKKTFAACEKELINIVKNKEEELINFGKVNELYNSYVDKIKNYSIFDRIGIGNEISEFSKKLKDFSLKNNYFKSGEFNDKRIIHQFKERIDREKAVFVHFLENEQYGILIKCKDCGRYHLVENEDFKCSCCSNNFEIIRKNTDFNYIINNCYNWARI